jgi:hypothetical protein
MLNQGSIHNTALTCDNVTHAIDIYGPEIGSLKEKTVHTTPHPVIPLSAP